MERAALGVKVNGVRLRELRTARVIRVTELARRAGISVQYLSAIERGSRNPMPAVVEQICEALQLSQRERRSLLAARQAT